MVLIRPRLGKTDWLAFGHARDHITAGYEAAMAALAHLDEYWDRPGSIFPRERFELHVSRERCTGCGICAALAPWSMGMDSNRQAFPLTRVVEWSPADRDFVSACPTHAIEVRPVDQRAAVRLPVLDVAITEQVTEVMPVPTPAEIPAERPVELPAA